MIIFNTPNIGFPRLPPIPYPHTSPPVVEQRGGLGWTCPSKLLFVQIREEIVGGWAKPLLYFLVYVKLNNIAIFRN